MNDVANHTSRNLPRRQFLHDLGTGAAMSIGALEAACTLPQPVDAGNRLSRSVSRESETIDHDQYRYDASFETIGNISGVLPRRRGGTEDPFSSPGPRPARWGRPGGAPWHTAPAGSAACSASVSRS